jgi:hypothetical protein
LSTSSFIILIILYNINYKIDIRIYKEMIADQLNDIISTICTYEYMNKLNGKKLRNIKNGVSLNDAINYKFSYASKDKTKDNIVGFLNYHNNQDDINGKYFERKSFESKENNIPTEFYESLLEKIIKLYESNCIAENQDELKLIAVDGSSTNDIKKNPVLNMGYYNVKYKVPMYLTYNGSENRNKEVEALTHKIIKHPEEFRNVVIIADRLYFTYKLLNFLQEQDIKYIIRVKGEANNLLSHNKLNKYNKDYDIIQNLRKTSRIIQYKNKFIKTIHDKHSKNKSIKVYKISTKNDCIIITNLTDDSKFSDDKILELYRSRWEIETYFKFIKNNFKFQLTKEKQTDKIKRLYLCEMMLTYIQKIIIYDYHKMNSNKPLKKSQKINDSHLMKGIMDVLLYDILHCKLTTTKLINFIKSYVIIIDNQPDRHFPRISKTPFTKWYVKAYSVSAADIKIIRSIEEDTIGNLNKNLKVKAGRIKIIKIWTINNPDYDESSED